MCVYIYIYIMYLCYIYLSIYLYICVLYLSVYICNVDGMIVPTQKLQHFHISKTFISIPASFQTAVCSFS